MEEKFYPHLNEVYADIDIINADDSCPELYKKNFKQTARLIRMELSEEGFSDTEIEKYLIHLVEEAMDY